MTSEDRRTYYASISRFVWANTLRHWVGSFVKATQNSLLLLDAYLPTPPLLIDGVIDAFADAATRLILLDYDGTLSPICKTPSAAVPSQGVLRALRLLTADPKNRVYIISGRDQATLEGWLGAIPRLGLSAEHGSFLRLITEPGETSNWTPMVNMEELTWKDAVMTILDYYTERTVGSLIEEKAASITWHYRLADPDFGSWQAKELQSHLESTIASAFPVEVVIGKKNIEVWPTRLFSCHSAWPQRATLSIPRARSRTSCLIIAPCLTTIIAITTTLGPAKVVKQGRDCEGAHRAAWARKVYPLCRRRQDRRGHVSCLYHGSVQRHH